MSHLEESGQLLTVRDLRVQLSDYKISSVTRFVLSLNLQKKGYNSPTQTLQKGPQHNPFIGVSALILLYKIM